MLSKPVALQQHLTRLLLAFFGPEHWLMEVWQRRHSQQLKVPQEQHPSVVAWKTLLFLFNLFESQFQMTIPRFIPAVMCRLRKNSKINPIVEEGKRGFESAVAENLISKLNAAAMKVCSAVNPVAKSMNHPRGIADDVDDFLSPPAAIVKIIKAVT